MNRVTAIVTDHGGRTSHAAIVSRELGLPAIVGACNAAQVLDNDRKIAVSCAEGDQGYVNKGSLGFETKDVNLDNIPETRTKIMLDLAGTAQTNSAILP